MLTELTESPLLNRPWRQVFLIKEHKLDTFDKILDLKPDSPDKARLTNQNADIKTVYNKWARRRDLYN